MKKIVLSLFLLASLWTLSLQANAGECSDAAGAKNYYVSKAGNDQARGSKSNPFKTIQKALDTAGAGSTIYVMDGTYKEALKFKHSGSKDNYITLKAVNKGKAKLTLKSGKTGAIINLNGKSYIKIDGFDIGNVTAKEVYGIYMGAGVSYVTISNNKIHDIKTSQPNNSGAGANGILCLGEGKTEAGAISHITISNNEVYNNVTGWSESISVAGNAKYVKVRKNKVHDNTNIGIDFYGNAGYCPTAKYDQPRFCEASENVVYRCKCSYADNAGIYVDGARDTVIRDNKVFDNLYGIEIGSEEGYGKDSKTPVTRIKVYGNTVYNNPGGGIRIGGYDVDVSGTVMDSEIYENLLTNNGSGQSGYNGEINIEKTKNVKVYNNIVKKTKASQNKYPMLNVGSDVPKKYISKLTLSGNKYYSTLATDKILFFLFEKEYKGISAIKSSIKSVLGVDMKDKAYQIK